MKFIEPCKNSDDTFDALAIIREENGKIEKDRLIENACKSPKFLNVCKLALDPFITYGVKKVKDVDVASIGHFDETTLDILNRLASRDLTGSAAQQEIGTHMRSLTMKSQELFVRILNKDLRGNFSAKSINRAKPGSIFIFDCMLAHKYEEKRITSWPVAVEPKYDGVRCLGIYLKGKVNFYSRTGKTFANYEHIEQQLEQAVAGFDKIPMVEGEDYREAMLFDGEIMSGEFNETVGAAHRKEQAVNSEYYIFEAMSLSDFDNGTGEDYITRRARLQIFFRESADAMEHLQLPPVFMMNNHDDIYTKHVEIMASGGEGVIVKPTTGMYEKKRSHNWLKIKDHNSADCLITGYIEGTGKLVGKIGAFIVDFNGVNVKVGSGLNDELRNEIALGDPEQIGRMIQVDYHEVTPDKSLRHPTFVRFRDDKPNEDGVGV